ncbi:MAG TPA: DUF2231 domain-containing protein [Gemmatimonadales bacterium]|nr:DUF2231 domain-containing protein [Gemmatimonadales bacterium]
MTWTHLHLALNHVPVIGILLVVLLLGAGVVRRNSELERTSYWLLAGLALIAVVVYFTGEPAEELVEGLPGYSEAMIEHHEEVALIATVGIVVLGLAAVVGLIRARRQREAPSGSYSKILLLLSLVVGGVMMWTANLGGQIRHTEIRPSAQAPAQVSGDKD